MEWNRLKQEVKYAGPLPAPYERVLCYIGLGFFAVCHYGKGVWRLSWTGQEIEDVVAWTPLPDQRDIGV